MAADDPLKERFEILRKRARQAATTAAQQEQEGLKRRFAQLGQVGSGAQIRAEAQAAERAAKRLGQVEETVGLAELAERQRLKETSEAREFARAEREAGQRFAAEQAGVGRRFAAEQAGIGRTFQAEQAGIGREFAGRQAELQRRFQRGERLGSQDFARLEAQAGRQFSQQERQAAQDFASAQARLSESFSAEQNKLARALQQSALDLQRVAFDEGVRQFDETFARDSETIEFNKKMAKDTLNQTLLDDLGLGGVLGGVGQGAEGLLRSLQETTGGFFGNIGDVVSSPVKILGGITGLGATAPIPQFTGAGPSTSFGQFRGGLI